MPSSRSLALVCFAVATAAAVAWGCLAPSREAATRPAIQPILLASGSPSVPLEVASVVPAPPASAVASAPAAVAPDPCAVARAEPPSDPFDLLFHVNRWQSLPGDFPAGDPRWTPCNNPRPASAPASLDVVCMPRRAALHGTEALRQIAWDSPAPADRTTTHDGLPVGRSGRVGFGPMIAAAGAEGLELKIRSAFRPISTQAYVFQTWVNERLRQGLSPTDAEHHANASSARPGHSEHQLGTTADLVHRDRDGLYYEGWDSERIATSPPMQWLAANAHRFGLVLSYGRETTGITQYIWEPWHYRFVGVETADFLHRCRLPLEAFLRARYGEPEPPAFELPPPPPAASSASARPWPSHRPSGAHAMAAGASSP